MKGFLSYLVGIPAYVWYTLGEWVIKHVFPKSFNIWFASEHQMIKDIELYLESKEALLHRQLEEKNKLVENFASDNENLRRLLQMHPTTIEANSSASLEGQVQFDEYKINPEQELLELIKVTQRLMLMYMKTKGDKLPELPKPKYRVPKALKQALQKKSNKKSKRSKE